jgi:hypothetical protein
VRFFSFDILKNICLYIYNFFISNYSIIVDFKLIIKSQIRYFSNIPMTSPVVRVALSFIISFLCISIRGWNQGIISGSRVEARDHLGV